MVRNERRSSATSSSSSKSSTVESARKTITFTQAPVTSLHRRKALLADDHLADGHSDPPALDSLMRQ